MIPERRSETERVRARRDELVNLMRQTRALVENAEDALRRADDFGDALRAATWSEEIHPGLGTVTIDGRGRIGSLQLDARTLRQTDAARFGERVLAAIHAAEQRAERQRREGLNEIFRRMGE